MIGLEQGITYDDEAHTQWAVSRHAWNRSKFTFIMKYTALVI